MKSLADLRPDQHYVIDFICEGEDALVYADVGSGKTVMGLTAMQRSGKRCLVMAPKKTALNVWKQEIDQWAHLQNLSVAVAVGTPDERLQAIHDKADVTVANYEVLQWFIDNDLLKLFQLLWCDEVDKLKDPTSKRFKEFRRHVEPFEMRDGATGTPAGTHLKNIWAQAFIVDGGKSLGRSYWKFLREYFYPADYAQFDWRPFPGAEQVIYDKLDGLVVRASAPKVPVIDNIRRLDWPSATLRKQYKALERKLFLQFEGGYVESMSEGVNAGKLQQFSAGFLYHDLGEMADDPNPHPYPRATNWLHHEKFDDHAALVSELQGAQLMTVYRFIAEREEYARRYPDMRFLGGNTNAREEAFTIAMWNEGALQHLGLHPGSAGHGLNLQLAKPRHIYFHTRPWPAGVVEQVIGRIARPGGADCVYAHTPVFTDSIDEDVLIANVYSGGYNEGAKAAFMRRNHD